MRRHTISCNKINYLCIDIGHCDVPLLLDSDVTGASTHGLESIEKTTVTNRVTTQTRLHLRVCYKEMSLTATR